MASEQSKKAHVGAGERPVTLADLPGDVLAHVAELTGSKLGDALPRLRATSTALAVPRPSGINFQTLVTRHKPTQVTQDLSRGVAKFLGLALPKKSGRRTRSQSEDPWRSLCNALKRKKEALKVNRDKEVWALWLRMHRNDCCTYLARALREDPGIVHHGLDFFAGRTLLFLAAWRDRPKCVKMLLNRGASPEVTDDLGCSPLIVASWAGAVEAVGELVKNRPARRTLLWRGEPPQQSSCGGRAPYTALQWALRKSGVATSWPEKERFGAVMELVEEAIFVPLAGEERIGGGFVVGE